MLVYLDTNVYQRPFNDQTQARIRREAEAFTKVLDAIQSKQIELLGSEILEFEIEQIPEQELYARVSSYLELCKRILKVNRRQLRLAQQLEAECGLKGRDALHVAAAWAGKATNLITCDSRLLRHAECCQTITRENGFMVTIVGIEQFVESLSK